MKEQEESWQEIFRKGFRCIESDCDGNGHIPIQNQDTGDYDSSAQCQFHAEYIFPLLAFISQEKAKSFKAGLERAVAMAKSSMELPHASEEYFIKEEEGCRGCIKNRVLDNLIVSLEEAKSLPVNTEI